MEVDHGPSFDIIEILEGFVGTLDNFTNDLQLKLLHLGLHVTQLCVNLRGTRAWGGLHSWVFSLITGMLILLVTCIHMP
jgi:hypothetical protein